jgi:hypothetical protein
MKEGRNEGREEGREGKSTVGKAEGRKVVTQNSEGSEERKGKDGRHMGHRFMGHRDTDSKVYLDVCHGGCQCRCGWVLLQIRTQE